MTASASIKVNGQRHLIDVDPQCPLLYVLRDTLALDNPRFGCGLGQCGACTVLIDNRAVRSCLYPVASAVGKEIVTLEGLSTPAAPHSLQQAFGPPQRSQVCGSAMRNALLDEIAREKIPAPQPNLFVPFPG